jgi:light-regulated signal transduction histidine kinase (bacteriophytochrome)
MISRDWQEATRALIQRRRHRRSLVERYGTALMAVVACGLIRAGLNPWLHDRAPFILFFIGVMFSAWYGGIGPAIFALIVSAAAGIFFFIWPAYSFAISETHEAATLVVFVVAAGVTSWISQSQMTAQQQAEANAAAAQERQRELEREIVQRRRAEREVQRMLRELQRSNRELQDFAFVASHDLQEPLRKILAFGDRIQTRYGEELPEPGRDYLARVLSAAGRMQSLINDLLVFSRVTTKAQPFQRASLDAVLDTVLDDLQIRIEKEGAKVEHGPMSELDADPSQMRQLFQNLIGNALKFRRPDVAPHVWVECEEVADDQVEIRVRDNGIGFDAHHAEKIFTVFQRLHGRGEYEGSGIGLSICRKIVERHGGSIRAESQKGAGATFIMRLPKRQIEAEEIYESER